MRSRTRSIWPESATIHLDPVEGGYKWVQDVEPQDWKWAASMQFIVVVGKAQQLTTVPLNFTDAVFRRVQDQGLQFSVRAKMPPGTKGFSIGFRCIPFGLLGTLQVPLSSLRNVRRRRSHISYLLDKKIHVPR
jgi:hypothetical protein